MNKESDLSTSAPYRDLLLTTKTQIPPARSRLIPRPHLIEQLNEGIGRKLTLVSAPAGFGKTTLLTQWSLQSKQPVAWVSLDENDNDVARFWAYFVTALRNVSTGVGDDILPLFRQLQPTSVRSVLTVLINDISSVPDHFVLVLDDYHVVGVPSIHDSLTFLLNYLPPQMHLVIASRTTPPLPLARLRAQGQLAELPAGDLRFLSDEADCFLNQVMGLQLSAENVAVLEECTEGWIAGLQLAALSVREQEDASGFIKAFAGSDHYILDYWGEEVLRRQSKSVQAFLLQTSILDRLTGSLCDTVTGQTNSQKTLEALDRANLFLFPLDNKRRWYRYHGLFADFLRTRLNQAQPDQVPTLHKRASEWYEHNGLTTKAVNHALAAGDLERAMRLIEQNGRMILLNGHLSTLLSWLNALPDALVRSRPRLCLYNAWASLSSDYQFDAAESYLQDAERALDTSADGTMDAARADVRAGGDVRSTGEPAAGPTPSERESILGEIAAIRAHTARLKGDMDRAIALSSQALDYLPDEQLLIRGLTAWIVGQAYRYSGDPSMSSQWLAMACTLSRAGDNIGLALWAIYNLARVQVMQGQLCHAAESWKQALELVGKRAWQQLPTIALINVGMSELLYEWNDLEAATSQVVKGIWLATQEGMTGVLLHAHVTLARVKQARGDSQGALATIQDAMQIVRGPAAPLHVAEAATCQTRLWLMQGDLEAATHWVQERGLRVDDEPTYERELEHLTLARVLLAQARFDTSSRLVRGVLGLLDRLLGAAQASGRTGSVIEIMALQALALHAQGETGRAMAALERALSLAEPEGYVRLFVDEGAPMADLLRQAASRGLMPDYVGRLLAAFGDIAAPSSPETQPRVEPLSEREIEVLRLLAARLRNQEIAEELSISVHTARTHIKNIYGKLGVHNRSQAVEQAKALGLLSDAHYPPHRIGPHPE